nr:oligopeptide/dipeptide ABC transporter ATP-binding protein [Bacillus dakarensis]
MYGGKIIEVGTVDEIFYNPKHPYTWGLISSMPDLETEEEDELFAIPGTPPNLLNPPKGDAFAPRNQYAMKIDLEKEPPMFKVSDTHYAATWLLHPDAPKVEPPAAVQKRMKMYQEQHK